MLRLAAAILITMICQSSFAQSASLFKEIVFQGSSGYRPGENFEYFLFKRGTLPELRGNDEETVITEWTKRHPLAEVVPVSIFGEKSKFPIIYIWAVDGEDSLNLYLVRKGIYPALAMLDNSKFGRLLQASSNAPYFRTIEMQERAGNPTGTLSRRLISESRYTSFVQQLLAAEAEAQAESIGIWSDKFKRLRDKIGLVPLSTLSLSTEQISSE